MGPSALTPISSVTFGKSLVLPGVTQDLRAAWQMLTWEGLPCAAAVGDHQPLALTPGPYPDPIALRCISK